MDHEYFVWDRHVRGYPSESLSPVKAPAVGVVVGIALRDANRFVDRWDLTRDKKWQRGLELSLPSLRLEGQDRWSVPGLSFLRHL